MSKAILEEGLKVNRVMGKRSSACRDINEKSRNKQKGETVKRKDWGTNIKGGGHQEKGKLLKKGGRAGRREGQYTVKGCKRAISLKAQGGGKIRKREISVHLRKQTRLPEPSRRGSEKMRHM